VPGTVSYDPATRTATFVPSSPFERRIPYRASVNTGVATLAGVHPATATEMKFAVANSPIAVTIETVPPGLSVVIDGGAAIDPQILAWSAGDSHTIAAAPVQSGGLGIRYEFAAWSDAGALSHPVTPAAAITYTAEFTTM
jgi:hypothetical protein